jgi:hypothetical protein
MLIDIHPYYRCYNLKCDCYSWAMVSYELLTLQKPFAVGSIEQHKKAVCERGERPPLYHLGWLSPRVRELLQHAWQANVKARWNMQEICDALEDIIPELERSNSFTKRAESFGSSFYPSAAASFVFCGAGDFVLDITNTVQTRYEQIFCQNPGTAATDSSRIDQNPDKPLKKDPDMTNESEEIGQEISLEGFLATTSYTMHQEVENCTPTLASTSSSTSNGGEEDDAFSSTIMEDPGKAQPVGGQQQVQGAEEHKELEGSLYLAGASISAALWGGASTRLQPPSERYIEASLCMHSERISVARARPTTASIHTDIALQSHYDFRSTRASAVPTRTGIRANRRASINTVQDYRKYETDADRNDGDLFENVPLDQQYATCAEAAPRRGSMSLMHSTKLPSIRSVPTEEQSSNQESATIGTPSATETRFADTVFEIASLDDIPLEGLKQEDKTVSATSNNAAPSEQSFAKLANATGVGLEVQSFKEGSNISVIPSAETEKSVAKHASLNDLPSEARSMAALNATNFHDAQEQVPPEERSSSTMEDPNPQDDQDQTTQDLVVASVASV